MAHILSTFLVFAYFHFKKEERRKKSERATLLLFGTFNSPLNSTHRICSQEEKNNLHCCARVERRISKASNFLILSFEPNSSRKTRGWMGTKIKLSSLMRRDKFNVLLLNYFGLAIHSAPLSFVRRSMAWNFLKNHIIYPFFSLLSISPSVRLKFYRTHHLSPFTNQWWKLKTTRSKKRDSLRFVELQRRRRRVLESVSVSPSGMNEAKRESKNWKKTKKNQSHPIGDYKRHLRAWNFHFCNPSEFHLNHFFSFLNFTAFLHSLRIIATNNNCLTLDK